VKRLRERHIVLVRCLLFPLFSFSFPFSASLFFSTRPAYINIHQNYEKQCRLPDLLSRGRQTRIMADYKFIIESPCKRERRRRRREHPGPPTHLAREYSRELDFAELPEWQRVCVSEQLESGNLKHLRV